MEYKKPKIVAKNKGVAEIRRREMVLSSATINYLKLWKHLSILSYSFIRARGLPLLIRIL